ncbi:MAG: FAD-dependent thymidylate synthase [Dehalococcoidia bacterium]|nr:FAD-dependent thymidylate synthase [Dehalococcoidia bacterium]
MDIIAPSFEILSQIDYPAMLKAIETAGRTAYKSENLMTEDSSERFVRMLLGRGHESVLEHINITVRFICDRGISHELVRHRLAAYTQESTRYVNYEKKGLAVIDPVVFNNDREKHAVWEEAMRQAEHYYNRLIEMGAKPEEARTVLPQSTKTEIVTTCNIREWRNILKLRTMPAAHPQMREIMTSLLKKFQSEMPALFNDIQTEA